MPKSLKTKLMEALLIFTILTMTGHILSHFWDHYVTRNEINHMKTSLSSLKVTLNAIGKAYNNLHKELLDVIKEDNTNLHESNEQLKNYAKRNIKREHSRKAPMNNKNNIVKLPVKHNGKYSDDVDTKKFLHNQPVMGNKDDNYIKTIYKDLSESNTVLPELSNTKGQTACISTRTYECYKNGYECHCKNSYNKLL